MGDDSHQHRTSYSHLGEASYSTIRRPTQISTRPRARLYTLITLLIGILYRIARMSEASHSKELIPMWAKHTVGILLFTHKLSQYCLFITRSAICSFRTASFGFIPFVVRAVYFEFKKLSRYLNVILDLFCLVIKC